MDQFDTTAKLWPGGASLDLGTDFNSVTVPAIFDRHAANFVTSMDGTHTYQFLFWNTGRHLTNKRHVHWSFNVGGWGHWTATRWYGTPPTGPGGGGPPRVHADAFTIGGDALVSSSPIDGPASSYATGAFPFMGNDHEIGTASGAANVVAKDPLATLQFAGWMQLVWGGDDSSTFYEDDSGSSPGSPSFYTHGTGPFAVAAGTSADLLATYGNTIKSTLIDWAKYVAELGIGDLPIGPGDPGPDDIIRLLGIQQLLQRTRPAEQGRPAGVDFESFIDGAGRMSAEELKLARQSVQTSLELGRIALSTIEAQLKRGAG